MASDVLMSLAGYDLDPNDEVQDDNTSVALLQQYVTTALQVHQTEYPGDTNYGINWIRIAEQKAPQSAQLAEQIREFLKLLPNFRDVRVTSTAQVGRTVSMSLRGAFQQYLFDGRFLVDPALSLQPGANSPVVPYLRIMGV